MGCDVQLVDGENFPLGKSPGYFFGGGECRRSFVGGKFFGGLIFHRENVQELSGAGVQWQLYCSTQVRYSIGYLIKYFSSKLLDSSRPTSKSSTESQQPINYLATWPYQVSADKILIVVLWQNSEWKRSELGLNRPLPDNRKYDGYRSYHKRETKLK